MSKLDIASEMRAFDSKQRDYMESMTEEEFKKFSPYILMRWGASVEGSAELQEWYLRAVNERININFFDISATQHKKLLWLMCTTASPGMGMQRHYWLAAKKKESSGNTGVKLLKHLYPNRKTDELELLAKINDVKEIKQLARDYGMSDKEIKEYLK